MLICSVLLGAPVRLSNSRDSWCNRSQDRLPDYQVMWQRKGPKYWIANGGHVVSVKFFVCRPLLVKVTLAHFVPFFASSVDQAKHQCLAGLS